MLIIDRPVRPELKASKTDLFSIQIIMRIYIYCIRVYYSYTHTSTHDYIVYTCVYFIFIYRYVDINLFLSMVESIQTWTVITVFRPTTLFFCLIRHPTEFCLVQNHTKNVNTIQNLTQFNKRQNRFICMCINHRKSIGKM